MRGKESIKKTAAEFEASFSDSSYYDAQTRDQEHLDYILKNLRIAPGMRILDLGTGTGYLAFPLAEQNSGCGVTGLDIVAATINRNNGKAKERNIENLQFISYDGEIFPFADDSFDIAVSRYAIHHFPDIELCFSELSRVLKPNGQLFISDPVPNRNDAGRFVDAYMQMKDDGHIRFYSLEEISDIAEKSGFAKTAFAYSKIRFPRKTAPEYAGLLEKTDDRILSLYEIEIAGDEIFITEDVLNISFNLT